MPAAHCVSSLEGIILYADQGFLELLQRREDEVIGTSYREITDPRDLQKSAAMLAVLEDGAAPVRLQKRYLRPDGTSIAANLLVTRFSGPSRLVSTLFWHENGRVLPPARLWEAALRLRHIHAARVRLFGDDLSLDPIEAILIGIYLAEAEGRSIGLDAVAAYARVPVSVADRWLEILGKRGIVETHADVAIDLQLTKLGLDQVEAMLSAFYELPEGAAIAL